MSVQRDDHDSTHSNEVSLHPAQFALHIVFGSKSLKFVKKDILCMFCGALPQLVKCRILDLEILASNPDRDSLVNVVEQDTRNHTPLLSRHLSLTL